MAQTRDFNITVRERVKRDPAFRKALRREAIDCLRSEEVEIGEALLSLLDLPKGKKATQQTHSSCQS